MTKVEEALAEVRNALAEFEPRLAGLRDFERLLTVADDGQEAKTVIGSAIETYTIRIARLADARNTLQALLADAHPNPIVVLVPPTVHAVLAGNVGTVEAAFSQFRPQTEATAGSVEFVEPA